MGVNRDPMTFETSRLLVRARNASIPTNDVDLKALLTSAVLVHLPSHLQDATSPTEWINARHAECEVLFASKKIDQSLLGLVLLAYLENNIHLGYLLAEKAWGQGYGTELVQGLLAELEKSGAERIFAGVGNDNHASARVLEKAGFHKAARTPEEDTESSLWCISL